MTHRGNTIEGMHCLLHDMLHQVSYLHEIDQGRATANRLTEQIEQVSDEGTHNSTTTMTMTTTTINNIEHNRQINSTPSSSTTVTVHYLHLMHRYR